MGVLTQLKSKAKDIETIINLGENSLLIIKDEYSKLEEEEKELDAEGMELNQHIIASENELAEYEGELRGLNIAIGLLS